MLRINKQKKLAILAIALTTLVIPVIAVTVNKINSVEDTFATSMPSGFNDQNFYNCVLTAFQTEYPGETVASTGLTDAQLAKITTLKCSGDGKSDAEKITSASGIEKMTSLTYLNLYGNKMQSIDLSNNPGVSKLWVDNILVSVGLEKTVDGSASTAEVNLASVEFIMNLSNNLIIKRSEYYTFDRSTATLTVSNLPATGGYVETEAIIEQDYDLGKTFKLKIANISSGSEDTNPMPEGFNDQKFYDCVLTEFRTEYPDETVASTGLTDAQLAKIKTVWCPGSDNSKISDAAGIEKMVSATGITLSNNNLRSIDVTHNPNLIVLALDRNELKSLDVSNNPELMNLRVYNNQLDSLDVTNNTKLMVLLASSNLLTTIDISNNPDLTDQFAVDDILVKANIIPVTTTVSPSFDLSELNIIGADQSIENTSNYVYNSSNKIVTVNNYVGTGGYVQVSSSVDNKTFKLQLPKFVVFDTNGGSNGPSAATCYSTSANGSCSIIVASEIPTKTGYLFKGYADSSDATEAVYALGDTISLSEPKKVYAVWSEDSSNDTNVPNTSGGKSDTKSPDTGVMKIEDDNSSSSTSNILPATVAVIVLTLTCIAVRKYLSRKRINF